MPKGPSRGKWAVRRAWLNCVKTGCEADVGTNVHTNSYNHDANELRSPTGAASDMKICIRPSDWSAEAQYAIWTHTTYLMATQIPSPEP